ncbi:WXG100 family type VII secretion target [Streptomyces sp. NPDC097727]|uniref:WXG100 family type VII secretion target n=1 Tax=Streptomyces sp. NPDC097727 TaxID=3366092 RepID=UPI00380C46EF
MGTDFDSRTHEEMLKWLDQASSGEIQGAADRLKSAASEIHKIAQDLKVRPQWVEWKGEGADAFRTWSADLANATLRLGDYSEAVSKCLGEASHAVALAQTSIPRPHAGDQAHLDAALAARNDPDAVTLAKDLIAAKEKNREEAAAQMRKLAQTYSFSSSQMKDLEKPVFPALPGVIAPDKAGDKSGGRGEHHRQGDASSAAGGYASSASVAAHGPAAVHDPELEDRTAVQAGMVSAPSSAVHAVPRPVGMDIDSVAVLPDSPVVPTATTPSLPAGGTVDRGGPPGPSGLPPIVSTGPVSPPATTGSNRTPGGGRLPISSGRVSQVTGPVSRPAGDSGIVGGRPAPQTSGRPMGGLPRGTVIGGEGTHSGRGPMMHGMGTGGLGGGRNGVVDGRRLTGETGGIVGGRPQQPGRTSARPFTPGGTGLVRGAEGVGASAGRSGIAPQRQGNARRGEGEERSNYLTEDEATWQSGRPVVPPVID